MAYQIDLSCPNCQKRHMIDAQNYIGKSITFRCKNCGSQITKFVNPPGETGQSKNLDLSVTTHSIPKSKTGDKKFELPFKKPNLPKLGVFGKNNKEDDAEAVQPSSAPAQTPPTPEPTSVNNQPVNTTPRPNISSLPPQHNAEPAFGGTTPQPQTGNFSLNIPGSSPAPAQPPIQNEKVTQPINPASFSPPVESKPPIQEPVKAPVTSVPAPRPIQAPIQRQPAPVIPVTPSRPIEITELSQPDNNNAMVHVPKPGMPFIAAFTTPSFYRAGSTKRKDYSFIVHELAKFRTAVGILQDSDTIENKAALKDDVKEMITTTRHAVKEEDLLSPPTEADLPTPEEPAMEYEVEPEAEPIIIEDEEPIDSLEDLADSLPDHIDVMEPVKREEPPAVTPAKPRGPQISLPVNSAFVEPSADQPEEPAFDYDAKTVVMTPPSAEEIKPDFSPRPAPFQERQPMQFTPVSQPTPVQERQPMQFTPESQPAPAQVRQPAQFTPAPQPAPEPARSPAIDDSLPKPPPSVSMEQPPGIPPMPPKRDINEFGQPVADDEDDANPFGSSNFSLDL